MKPSPPSSRSLKPAIGLTLLVIAMIAMLVFSWRAWPDPLADFGREVYVPWQLAQGKVLYRDIAYFNGPLSPYINAMAFWLFGAHLNTLILLNVLVITITAILIWRLVRDVGSALAANL